MVRHVDQLRFGWNGEPAVTVLATVEEDGRPRRRGEHHVWVDDVLGRMATGFAYWGSNGGGINLRVDQHNVMQAARIVMDEAERFRATVQARRLGLTVSPGGGDPVSKEAAEVLNAKFWGSSDSYYQRCLDYANMLEKLARQLGEAARTYGITEDEIESMFAGLAQDDS